MKYLSAAELRRAFLEYFNARGHEIVASSPLVPANDPTLLFTNAGMVQFKDTFLGTEQRSYRRATTSQRCVRAGGKHNDLENVGYTARHHTFFEMLGNFSFGDYFKRDAIRYAWEFLTEVLALPAERLWVTVYQDDDEAAEIWLNEIGVSEQRFTRIGTQANFWQMGDTGPCGPCSEVFYDHGPEVAGGPPGSADEEGDRYIEIWNLVFMQFDRAADGRLTPLPKQSVDTGMGLERLAAVVQGVHSNYEIDLFQNLLAAAAAVTGCKDLQNNSLRVIADHIRSCAFLITDGVLPANDGRGYVLRRIIRRAVRHGHKLGMQAPFFYRLVAPLVDEMGDAFPELAAAQSKVRQYLQQEEQRFFETLDQGMRVLEAELALLETAEIPGATVFKLYDTFGFPVDLTNDIARERGLQLDMPGYETAMAAQVKRSQERSKFVSDTTRVQQDEATQFVGYEALNADATIVGLYHEGQQVAHLKTGDHGLVLLDTSPFYAEAGGQVGDRGELCCGDACFQVSDTQKQGAIIVHHGELRCGDLKLGEVVHARVDQTRRLATVRNHSATHLLHAALRQQLGAHVEQKGSRVAPDYLRFDFSHPEPLDEAQLVVIQDMVNAQVRANLPTQVQEMRMDEAIQAGALAFFGDKYGERVRVLSMGEFSMELCGGTHVERTGDIGYFKVISENGIASGVRRIEAVTGVGVDHWIAETQGQLRHIGMLMKASPKTAAAKVAQLIERNRELEKKLQRLQASEAARAGDELLAQAVDIQGIKVLSAQLEDADRKTLRDTVERLKPKLGNAVIVLGAIADGEVALVAGVTNNQTKQLHAGALVQSVAVQIGGKGGGRPDMAQGGGKNLQQLQTALKSVTTWVEAQLA